MKIKVGFARLAVLGAVVVGMVGIAGPANAGQLSAAPASCYAYSDARVSGGLNPTYTQTLRNKCSYPINGKFKIAGLQSGSTTACRTIQPGAAIINNVTNWYVPNGYAAC
jgi:hypothetical protein